MLVRTTVVRRSLIDAYATAPPPVTSFAAAAGPRGSARDAAHQRLAAQFSSLEGGWQSGQDQRFDDFVERKRTAASFEEFDQRVERAYTVALRQHKAEVWNGVKRRLSRTATKVTPQVLTEVHDAMQDRERWLRDYFASVDADYRSGDTAREQSAAGVISTVLQGRAGDLMMDAYERKVDRRSKGPAGQAEVDAESEAGPSGPEVSEDEANRYAGLRMSMRAIERAVIDRFGRAGREHWQELQAAKDSDYVTKLNKAAAVYKDLLAQQQAYDERQQNVPLRQRLARIHRAQVRFQASMQLEASREELLTAHAEMEAARAAERAHERRQKLERAAAVRAAGGTEEEARAALRRDTLDRLNRQQTERAAEERSEILARKRVYMTMLDEMERQAEHDDGAALMGGALAAGPGETNKTADAEGDALGSALAAQSRSARQEMAQLQQQAAELAAERHRAAARPGATPPARTATQRKAAERQALWHVLNRDQWEDPFQAVHQARLDAAKTYTELYSLSQPSKLRLGRKAARGGSENKVNGQEHTIIQDPWVEGHTFNWGLSTNDVHNLDMDGTKEYFSSPRGWHVRDPNTRDIDYRYEKRLGRGARWTGPKFYKQGIDARHDRDNTPESRPMREDGGVVLQQAQAVRTRSPVPDKVKY